MVWLKSCFFVLMAAIWSPIQSQPVDTRRFKPWNADQELQWSDYRVKQQRMVKHGFVVSAITSYQYYFLPRELHLDSCLNVLTLFRKRTSWMKDTVDRAVLEHEQIHFDIAEVYARKMRKKFQSVRTAQYTLGDVYHQVNSLIEAADCYQEQYDEETFYGRSSRTQQRWRDRVDEELKQLEEFSFGNTCATEDVATD